MDEIIYFSHNEKSSVLLIFFFNAVLFSYLLFKNGFFENKQSSKWLATFIILGGLYICPFMLGYAGWYGKDGYFEIMFFVPFQQLFLIGPVFYFYVKSLLNKNFRVSKREILHFLPAIIYLGYSLVIVIVDKLILDKFYFYDDGRDKDLAFWYQMSGLISMLFYLYLSLNYYLKYRKRTIEEVSYADDIAFKWVQHFTVAFSLILILRVLFFILNPEWGNFGSKYWYYLCFSILLLYISITGYTNTIKRTIGLTNTILDTNLSVETNSQVSEINESNIEFSDWKNKILDLFDSEKVYINPNLTLSEIATLLDTNRNIVSKVINQSFEMNFNDFVNQKRAEGVIQKLKNGDHKQSTLLGIALDCGFNSKTTFNRAFKKYTSSTPKQYIIKHQL